MTEQFIGAAIQPVAGTIDASRMSTGQPGLPWQFRWGAGSGQGLHMQFQSDVLGRRPA